MAGKGRRLKKGSGGKRAAASQRAQKAAATRAAGERAAEAKRFADAASRRYGAKSQTAKRLKEVAAQARAAALEAKQAKSLSAKKKARARAGKLRQSAALTFKTATQQPTRGQARQRGWVELAGPAGPASSADTFTSYEHARYGAGSVLSLLEARPGVVGVQGWRRVSQVERDSPQVTARGELSPELRARADAVAAELGMSPAQRRDFDDMLLDAELYGVEVELEVENYLEGAQ